MSRPTNHSSLKYCPDCKGILDGTKVGAMEYCPQCEKWKVGVNKFHVVTDIRGHELTEKRKQIRKILYGWCDECNCWMRLRYATPPKRNNEPNPNQMEIPF